jgi:tetratricopeptide (TPR) repeat protein
LGRRDEGVGFLELCLAINENHGLAHYNLSVALLGLGQAEEAKEHLTAAVEAGVEAHPAFVADLERALH